MNKHMFKMVVFGLFLILSTFFVTLTTLTNLSQNTVLPEVITTSHEKPYELLTTKVTSVRALYHQNELIPLPKPYPYTLAIRQLQHFCSAK